MAHARQTIREAVKTQLVGTGPGYRTLAGTRVYKTRFIPLERTKLPAIMVYTLKEPVDPASRSTAPRRLKRELELVIEGIVEAGNDVDDAMDTLASQIECAVNSDDTFGVEDVGDCLLNDTEMEVGAEGAKLIGLVRLKYTVTYYTSVTADDVDCAPTLDDFETVDAKWNLGGQQDSDDQAEDTFDVEE